VTSDDSTQRFLCLSVDVQGYGSRDDVRQAEIQAELIDVLDAAGARAGLHRSTWVRQPKGDEELCLVPASEPLHRVVSDFCLEVDALLRRRNVLRDEDKLRFRIALDDGPVQLASNGFAGRCVVAVNRMVNSQVIRQALALAPDANLVVVLSGGVFRDWVRSGRSSARPEWFRRVSITEKEFAESAWLWIPGADVHRLTLVSTRPLSSAWAASLPWPGAHFIGRSADLARATSALRRAQELFGPTMCAISGMPGVGKTTLAIHVARQVARHYPDGCIFIDLHGHAPGVEPDQPIEVLDRILRRVGVSSGLVPNHLDDRVALLRERLIGRRLLVVLDDARNVAQVRPLLATTPGSATLITSRSRLTALDEATFVDLDVMPDGEAATLFRSVGALDWSDTAHPVVGQIIARCARLPLAIRIAAARYRAEPGRGLDDLCRRLDDERSRLAELDDGDRSVAASLAVSCEALPDEQGQLFAGLGAHPPGEIDVHAAAALADTSITGTRRLLDALVDRHLLARPSADRYRFHDLVGDFARTHALARWRPAERLLAVHRLVDYYLTVAELADAAITPHRHRIDVGIEHHPAAVPDVGQPDAAVRWLMSEERTLVQFCRIAADFGLDAQCWQLSHLLRGYFFLTKRWDAWIETHDPALAAARRLGDRRAEATTLNNAGLAAIEQGRHADARGFYRDALRLFEAVEDGRGVHTARTNLAWTGYFGGRYEEFLDELRRTFEYHSRHGSLGDAAIALRGIALGELEIGETTAAVQHLRDAEATFETLGLDLDLAMTCNALGEAFARSGQPERAAACHDRAIVASGRCGSIFETARARHRLGDLAAARGDYDVARDCWTASLAGYVEIGGSHAAEVRRLLAEHPT
jgi:hypothetical protein